MGGSVSNTWRDVTKSVESIPVIGKPLSTAGQTIGSAATLGIPQLAAGVDRGLQGYKTIQNAPRDAANAADAASRKANNQAEDIKQQMLLSPKQVTPDNFLANKAKQLASLRMGFASTIAGSGGAPSSVLGSPSLASNYPGKAKLGQ